MRLGDDMFSTTSKRRMAAASAALLLGGWVTLDALAPDSGPPGGSAPAASCAEGPATVPTASNDDRYRRSIVLGPLLHWAV